MEAADEVNDPKTHGGPIAAGIGPEPRIQSWHQVKENSAKMGLAELQRNKFVSQVQQVRELAHQP